MGNDITLSEDPKVWLSMSNGGTEVLSDVLALAGARLTHSKREIYLSTWISAALDQEMPGRGCAGFDIKKDFPWQVDTFEQDKSFILSLIQEAKQKTLWGLLTYSPSEEHIMSYLSILESLLKSFDRFSIDSNAEEYWVNDLIPENPSRCPKHNCFMHEEGCIVCHNDSHRT